jgi:hypothetical protein
VTAPERLGDCAPGDRVYLRGVPAVLVVLNDEEGAVARGRVPLLDPKTLSLVTALPSTRLGGWQPAERLCDD